MLYNFSSLLSYCVEALAEQKRQKNEAFRTKIDLQSEILGAISERLGEDPRQSKASAKQDRQDLPKLDTPREEAALAMAQTAIGFQALYPDKMALQDTGSWIGGLTQMRSDAVWPVSTDVETRLATPMHFLVQIDCSKLPKEGSSDFPASGYLSFFANLDSMQTSIIYSAEAQELQEFQLPKGIKPIFPRKQIDKLAKIFIKPILFQSTPSFDHLFGTTHDKPIYKFPDWDDDDIELASESLEKLNRKAYDHALIAEGVKLPDNFKQLEPSISIQSSGWVRTKAQDLVSDSSNVILLSLDYDVSTGEEYSNEGDVTFVVQRDKLAKRDFSQY